MPSSPTPAQRISQLVWKITGALAFLAPLLTRLVIGEAYFITGRGKAADLSKVAGFFADSGIPFPAFNAAFVSYLELIGGICLMLGLGTRIFAFLLSGSMVVALMTADKESFVGKFPTDVTDVTSFTYLLFLIWLVLYGPGPISLDYLISKWLGLKKEVEAGAPAQASPASS